MTPHPLHQFACHFRNCFVRLVYTPLSLRNQVHDSDRSRGAHASCSDSSCVEIPPHFAQLLDTLVSLRV